MHHPAELCWFVTDQWSACPACRLWAFHSPVALARVLEVFAERESVGGGKQQLSDLGLLLLL